MGKTVELAQELRRLKDKKDELAEQEKIINIRIDEITKRELPEAMDAEGISNIKVENAGKVSLRGEVYAAIPAEARDAAYEWLRENGKGSLITETVNASTLKAAAKDWLKQGMDVPADLIKITPVTVAVLTRG